MAGRAESRNSFASDIRIRLLEDDADRADLKFRAMEQENKERDELMDTRLGKITGILTGILVALTTASILLAINVIVQAGG